MNEIVVVIYVAVLFRAATFGPLGQMKLVVLGNSSLQSFVPSSGFGGAEKLTRETSAVN